MTAVRVGQVWADLDKRSAGRHVKVVAIEDAKPAPDQHHRDVPARAVVVWCNPDGRVHGREKRTRIRLDRFRPTSNGYQLVKDAPEETTR